jgi:hypothetical protein
MRYKATSHLELYKSLLRSIHNRVPHRPFPPLVGVHATRILMSLITLYTCCTTEATSGYLFVMTCHSAFTDASFCAQYFRNLCAGMSAILAYPQVSRLFSSFAQHCSQQWPGGKLHRYHLRKNVVNTVNKVKSVKTTLFNICFVQIIKSNQYLV